MELPSARHGNYYFMDSKAKRSKEKRPVITDAGDILWGNTIYRVPLIKQNRHGQACLHSKSRLRRHNCNEPNSFSMNCPKRRDMTHMLQINTQLCKTFHARLMKC